jgi:outer membrane receptor protein involved in Fe transport
MQFALYHTWHFVDEIDIAPGVPTLDLLDGAAIGYSGGQARHELQGQAGYTNNGIGIRGSANWQSATRVDGALGAADQSLRFSDLATVDLRLFANFGQMPKMVRDHPFLRGTRLTLSLNNLFNSRQEVRDATGTTPLRYQPGYLDPLGRQVTVSFRKLFF